MRRALCTTDLRTRFCLVLAGEHARKGVRGRCFIEFAFGAGVPCAPLSSLPLTPNQHILARDLVLDAPGLHGASVRTYQD